MPSGKFNTQFMDVLINGHLVSVQFNSDIVVAKRVAAHIERRLREDDWRPYRSKQDAISAWTRLGGIRVEVLRAFGLIA